MSEEVRIYIGGLHASERPTVIKTLLGSCVAVCLAREAATAGPAVIVARLHGLETLDTSATQVLLALRQILVSRGGRLSVEGTPASVVALWQRAGLHQHLA